MTTKISTVYPAIVSLLGTLFSTKTRIPYANDLASNTDKFLRNGYGVWIDNQSVETLEFNRYTVDYSIIISLTREVIKKDNDYAAMDTALVDIMEDMNTVVLRFYNPDQIAQEANIENIVVNSISPVQEIYNGTSNYFYINISLSVKITEDI